MSLHPDAAALLRAFLDRPTDETPRLVLADWLDDTGLPENAAWAGYIRTRCNVARLTAPSAERTALLHEADRHAAGITTTLTVPAARFVCAPAAFLTLLPADRIAVEFGDYTLPAELAEVVPESVARTCRVVSLSPWGEQLYLVTADPADQANAERLEFILNRAIVFLRAPADEIDRAIETSYPFTEVESVTEELLIFEDPPSFWANGAGDDAVTPFVNLVLLEAVRIGATWAEIRPTSLDAAGVWYRVDDVWIDRESIPRPRLAAVVDRLAGMAELAARGDGSYPGSGTIALATDGIEARFTVVIELTPFGPWVGVEVLREPDAPVAGP